MDEDLKPRLRGVSHLVACMVAVGATVALAVVAGGPRARLAGVAFSLSMVLMFGASALYHVPDWKPRISTWLRRLDHSAIYVFMAGCYTPFCLLALHGQTATRLLALAWIVAGLGVLKSLLWVEAPRFLTAGLYLAMGWMVAPYIPLLGAALGGLNLGFLFAGGALFTAGALVYIFEHPDPVPSVFGYHEVFHVMVIAGCICVSKVVATMVLAA